MWGSRTPSRLRFGPLSTIRRMGHSSLDGEVPQDDLGDGGAPAGDVAPGAHLPLEDGRERVLVGDVEHAERGDRLVDLDGVHALPEAALALAALEDALDRVDDGPVERAHDGRLLQVPAPRLVLRHDQPHEALVLEVVGVGELHDATDRVHRGKVIQIETALRLADVRVDLLQHGQVDLLLAAEVDYSLTNVLGNGTDLAARYPDRARAQDAPGGLAAQLLGLKDA